MSLRLYRTYLFLAKTKARIRSKVSSSGRLFIVFAALSVLFGFNTKQTMIYQLAALFVMFLFFSFPFSFFFSPTIRMRRFLPKTCTAGEKLTYLLQFENTGEKTASGLIFKEQSGADYPTFEDFISEHEYGEKDRNYFDRKLGYYRWQWLFKRNAGARFASFTLPQLLSHEQSQVEVSLLPLRRGYIQLRGYSIHRLDPLGLFKNEILFKDIQKLLVMPKMYPVVHKYLTGSRKYHLGGLASAASCGESGEFVSLREYRPGDPVKHIDWKVTARVGSPTVRQYQDEYFSRYGILLDTFTEQEGAVFEDAVSIAVSIIAQQDVTRNSIDLLFASDNCIPQSSIVNGLSDQHHMLEILACITRCHDQEFSTLADLVIEHTGILSGLILVLVKIDDQRQQLLNHLKNMKIPYKAILVSDDRENSLSQLRTMSLSNINIFDIKSDTKIVELT
ncbi:MAG: hypothetical protein ACI8ZB_004365 [Desulforhopalus sp.]|jgi:uncharacterized protein (DUF58 family)